MQKNRTKINWVFFGTSDFSVIILNKLKLAGFIPSLIVTTEDKPQGRKLVLTPPAVKIWAKENNVTFIQPKTLKDPALVLKLSKPIHLDGSPIETSELFIVASYGKIIPQNILDIPKYKTLNVHPSILPKLRGAAPIQEAILRENKTGVTIMRLDAEMDHGPIVAQLETEIQGWPPYADDLKKMLGELGGDLLAKTIPDWLGGKIKEREQNHELATYCQKIEKSDGELNPKDSIETKLRKIRAYNPWPGAYYFDGGKRIIVKEAHLENNELILDRIIPEGKKEMNYKDYLRGKK